MTHEIDLDLAATVRTPSGEYPVWVGWDILGSMGERVQEVVSPSRAFVIGDSGAQGHAQRALESLRSAGIDSEMLLVDGASSPRPSNGARNMYHWLGDQKAERGHLVVAVGGGRDRRRGGFRGLHVRAGDAPGAGPHHAALHARLVDRRKDGHRPSPREEPGGDVPPASIRALRRQRGHYSSPPAADRRMGRGHQARADQGRFAPVTVREGAQRHPGHSTRR